ncbi:MAG: molybdopterin molybdotransferase MoeA [Myxococcales bacterium]|nr:molybdopterin molybdotransferase MoeA [Myxococcales bacterium]
MIDLDEAQALILANVRALGAERVPARAAMGRVLARDLHAREALPAFDHSAMDGYAIELDTKGEERTVLAESRAGGPTPPALARGTAMRIFTGAPTPVGTQAVVMQENVSREGDRLVIRELPKAGANIRARGVDVAEGALCIPRGTRLGPQHLPLLLTFGELEPQVVRRPIVTVLATGDELRAPGDPPRAGTIVETNGPTIAAFAEAAGAVARVLPIAADEPVALRAAVEEALANADVVFTIGGVSVGDHDLVRPTLEAVGVTLDFHKVALKPGKPIAFGRRGSTYVLGLPGNVVSAAITYLLFGAPLLAALSGVAQPLPVPRRMRLGAAVKHQPGRTELVRVRVEGDSVVPLASQASGSIVSLGLAEAVAVVPKDSAGLAAGETVDVLFL